jgi:hypothetical protein
MNAILPISAEPSQIDRLVDRAIAALPLAPEPIQGEVSVRERFMEFIVLSLANLFGKTPIAASLLDRTLTKAVSDGMDDNEAGKLSIRADDWMRLEGLLRVQEGQKNYTLNRPSMAVLCTTTPHGLLGEVMERIMAAYAQPGPSAELRQVTRLLGAHILTRLARS